MQKLCFVYFFFETTLLMSNYFKVSNFMKFMRVFWRNFIINHYFKSYLYWISQKEDFKFRNIEFWIFYFSQGNIKIVTIKNLLKIIQLITCMLIFNHTQNPIKGIILKFSWKRFSSKISLIKIQINFLMQITSFQNDNH